MMENPICRERVLLGYDVSGSVGVTCLASPKIPFRHSAADVFGGPPRSSMEEDGQTCRETVILSRNKNELPAHSDPWSAPGQRSVFGEESPSRRHLAKDFYDDIFKMEDPNLGSRRRYSDVTHYSPSIAASRGLSPVNPSTPNIHEPSSVAKPALIRQLSFSRIGRRSESSGSTPNISPKRSKHSAGGSQRSKDEGSPTKVKDNSSSHFSLYKWAAKGMPFPSAFKGRSSKESKNDTTIESSVESAKVLANDKHESFRSVSYRDFHSKKEEVPFKSSVDMLHELLRKDDDGNLMLHELLSKDDDGNLMLHELLRKDDDADISFVNGNDTQDKMNHVHTVDSGLFKSARQVLEKSANSRSWKAESAVGDNINVHKKIFGKENIHKGGSATKLPQDQSPNIKEDVGKRESGKVQEFVKKFNNEEQLKSTRSKEPNALKQKNYPSYQTKLEKKTYNKLVEHDDHVKVPQTPEHPEPLQFMDEGSVTENFGTSFHCIEVTNIIEDNQEQTPMSQEIENIQVLDAKIRKWSNGKEANLRALLSTLQYVLWPESGWKPVPLVDIIESTSVKRTYQKTMLYLHPDKLQQKGASAEQKHTAARVFDILQEAWNHFNTLSAL